MTLPAIQQQRDQIDTLFHVVRDLLRNDALATSLAVTLQAQLTQHLCVRVAGFIETSTRTIYYEHARRRGSITVARFVSRSLDRQPGPNCEYLSQLAGQFDPTWEADLRAMLVGEHKEAVDGVVSTRHRIAHGESVTLGFTQLESWYRKIVDVVEFIELQAV